MLNHPFNIFHPVLPLRLHNSPPRIEHLSLFHLPQPGKAIFRRATFGILDPLRSLFLTTTTRFMPTANILYGCASHRELNLVAINLPPLNSTTTPFNAEKLRVQQVAFPRAWGATFMIYNDSPRQKTPDIDIPEKCVPSSELCEKTDHIFQVYESSPPRTWFRERSRRRKVDKQIIVGCFMAVTRCGCVLRTHLERVALLYT